MPSIIDKSPVRPAPSQTTIPDKAPKWFSDFQKEQEKWDREIAIALRQVQSQLADTQAALAAAQKTIEELKAAQAC